ncbi:PorP/SprF family type IX secretion system membrane protein [Maribacter halichondriae]|uniref:PorP/SprF family type IX secretion system membrane protein n=1 Tax=Maribacter halichondriae TaxID=2980554 RepID=UPI002359BF09|nr:type IX secretion system membrane protein PorP/SprF [Maribacter sp. Hal144]
MARIRFRLTFRNIIFFLGLVFFFNKGHAQNEPQYTQYMYNIGSFNPAYSSSVLNPEIALMYRAQWLDIEGAPRTLRLGTNVPFLNRKHGIGFNVVSDQLGPVSQTFIDASYSYQVQVTDEINLSFGMDVGGALLNLDYSKGTFEGPEPRGDGRVNKFYPTIGAGLFMYQDDLWYFGVSAPNFLGDGVYKDEVAAIVEGKMQFNFIGGYVFDVSENLKFKPAFLMNYIQGAPLNANISANFLINNAFTAGASYRVSNAVSALAGFQISPSVFVGYSYDYNTNPLGRFNSGSHEMILKFYLGKGGEGSKSSKRNNKGKPKQIDTPRFF